MNKFILCVGLTFCLCYNASSQIVAIPDSSFKAYLLDDLNINTNGDDEIQVSEAEVYDGKIQCASRNIASLEGLEAFKELTELNCINNNLTSIDLSGNPKLERLSAYSNPGLGSIDITLLPELVYFNCHHCSLTELDISGNPKLKDLYFQSNSISSIYLPPSNILANLIGYENELTSIDITQQSILRQINISDNPITSLDVSNNPEISTLRIKNMNLTKIDVSSNLELRVFYCEQNNISSLDISKNPKLSFLNCSDNLIDSITFDSLNAMVRFFASSNKLKEIDFSTMVLAEAIYVDDNELTSLNIATGSDTLLTDVITTNNPDLLCIQVDDVEYAINAPLWNKDESAVYNLDCSTFSSTKEELVIHHFQVYPNPANTHINFPQDIFQIRNIKLVNSMGTSIEIDYLGKHALDISTFPSGIYSLVIEDESGAVYESRFIKM